MTQEMLKETYENMQYITIPKTNKNRVHKCQAWYEEIGNFIVLQSYDTIVAVYSKSERILYSFGRYSMTTYQHIRKFRNDYLPDMHNTKEINCGFVNWF